MISWVSCSENGNTVPNEVRDTDAYHLLVPRWADRLEAVGKVGVVRCYRYNQEKGAPLHSAASPRPRSRDEVYRLASPDRFERYRESGGRSADMISHYYDKLLHIARPPPEIVRNAYLERAAEQGAEALVEVCLRFGRTGEVDEEFILELERSLALDDAAGSCVDRRDGANTNAEVKSEATSAAVSPLDTLPSQVMISIFAKYCDTPTLSASLTALISSLNRREYMQIFAAAMRVRVANLERQSKIPATKGGGRWNRQCMNIADELRNLCSFGDGSSTDELRQTCEISDGSNSSGGLDVLLRQLQKLVPILPMLSLFEDESSLKGTPVQLHSKVPGKRKAGESSFELLLWVGFLPICLDGVGGASSRHYIPKVAVTTPSSTWQPILLLEWAKLNVMYGLQKFNAGSPMLRPRPRRATPLPPLARIRSISGPTLQHISEYLTKTDEVIEIDVPKGNRILVMSRLQACALTARLRSSSIWQFYLKNKRELVEEETWSLAYGSPAAALGDTLVQLFHDPFSGRLGVYDDDSTILKDSDLFAFMEPTDESNNETTAEQVFQMTNTVKQMLCQL